MQHVVIIGATSAIAQACLRIWLQCDVKKLTLAGRASSDLDALAIDISVRYPAVEIHTKRIDFENPSLILEAVSQINTSQDVDQVLVALGSLLPQSECCDNVEANARTLWTNGISAALVTELFATSMQHTGGSIGVISSVAGDRGRRSNYSYGAGKSLLSTYISGLQHRLQRGSLKITLIKPGPVLTPMTLAMPTQPRGMADVESVARDIAEAIEKGRPLIYTPIKWKLIMAIIQLLPRFIFNRLDI